MCAPDDSVSPGRFFLKAGTMMRKFFDFFNLKTGSIFRFLSGKLLIVSAGQYPSTVVRVGDVPVAPNHIARGRTMSAPGLRIRVGQYPHLGRRVGGCVEDLIHAGSSPPGPQGSSRFYENDSPESNMTRIQHDCADRVSGEDEV